MNLNTITSEVALLMRQEKFEQALTLILKVRAQFGSPTNILINEATCYAKLGNVVKALDTLKNIDYEIDDVDLVQRAISKIYYKIGAFSNAIKQLGYIPSKYLSSESLQLYARCYVALGEYGNAANFLHQLLATHRNYDSEVVWSFVLYREISGELSRAHNELKEIARTRDCVEIKLSLAIITKKLGNLDLALRLLTYIDNSGDETDYRAGNEIASIHVSKGEIEQGISKLQALALNNNNGTILGNLSRAYAKLGAIKQSNSTYNRIPDSEKSYALVSNHLMQQLYFTVSRDQLLATHIHECIYFNKNNVISKGKSSPNKKLKILLVSSDFKRHSVAYFVGGLFSNKPKNVELHCAYNGDTVDEITEFFKRKADSFVNSIALADEGLITFIYEKNIDIIVELNGHTAGNRLSALSRIDSIPIVSAIGYPATTAIRSIKYRITDKNVDPEIFQNTFTEKNLYTNGCYLNYHPFDEIPEIFKPERECFIFGSFNNYQKIGEDNVAVWSTILDLVPNSKLLLKSGGIKGESIAKKLYNSFEANGVSSDRIILSYPAASYMDHLMQYRDIDLALDTFPFGGATTTFEALYMNTPVLTLSMPVNQGRVTHSVLKQLKLDKDFSTANQDDYIKKAIYWSDRRQKNRLNDLSTNLRTRMKGAGLVNDKSYVDDFFKLLEAVVNEHK